MKKEREELNEKIAKVLEQLNARGIYPTFFPQINGAWIKVECPSPYYNGSKRWFVNFPKTDEDWKLMKKYVALRHSLVCPYPEKCPTLKWLKG